MQAETIKTWSKVPQIVSLKHLIMIRKNIMAICKKEKAYRLLLSFNL